MDGSAEGTAGPADFVFLLLSIRQQAPSAPPRRPVPGSHRDRARRRRPVGGVLAAGRLDDPDRIDAEAPAAEGIGDLGSVLLQLGSSLSATMITWRMPGQALAGPQRLPPPPPGLQVATPPRPRRVDVFSPSTTWTTLAGDAAPGAFRSSAVIGHAVDAYDPPPVPSRPLDPVAAEEYCPARRSAGPGTGACPDRRCSRRRP